MTPDDARQRIQKIIESIQELPEESQPAMMDMVKETIERHIQISSDGEKARGALADWRIAMIYAQFDFECRLRESHGSLP